MSEEVEPKRLTAIHIDPDTAERTVLGEVEYGAAGQLALLAATAGYEKYLEDFIGKMNKKDVLNVKVSGGTKFALGAETYARTDPNFFKGLREYVKYYYCLELASDDDQQLNPEEFEDLKL